MKDSKHEFYEAPESRAPGTAHRWLLPDLKAWLDGELSVPRAWFVRAHLWICPACREEVTWLKRLGEDMRDLERAVPSPRLRARILAALPDAPPGRPEPIPVTNVRWMRLAAAGAMACAVIGVTAAIIQHSNPAPSPVAATHPRGVTHDGLTGAPQLRPTGIPEAPAVTAPPTDPYSIEADRRLALWQQEQQECHSRQLARNRANWTKLVASLRDASSTDRAGKPFALGLAVPDVGDADRRIVAWASAAGGAASGPPSVSPSPGTVAPLVTTGEPPPGTVTGERQPLERIITVRVPAARVASLESALRQMGALQPVSTAPRPAHRTVRQVKYANKGGAPAAERVDAPPSPGNPAITAAVPKVGSPDQVSGRDGGIGLVTVQLHLTALEAPLP